MNEIHIKNTFGISFLWKRNTGKDIHRVQIVFKETGLFLTHEEIIAFKQLSIEAHGRASSCNVCPNKKSCKQLLETPFHQLSFALTFDKIKNIIDLLENTLFEIKMERLLIHLNIS